MVFQSLSTPWKKILTSGPFYAIVVAHASYTWVTSWTMSYLPKYFKDMMKFDLQEVGWSEFGSVLKVTVFYKFGFTNFKINRGLKMGTGCNENFSVFKVDVSITDSQP